MVVKECEFLSVLAEIQKEDIISVDTETTGLKVYQTDRLFSIILADSKQEYYFNFNTQEDHLGSIPEVVLPRHYIPLIVNALEKMKLIFMANAKFDMAMLQKECDFDIKWPDIHDVLVMDRLVYSDQIKINLETVAKRNGLEKSGAVEVYIEEHHLWAWEVVPHRKKRDKLKFFYLVPFSIIVPYGCIDARITYSIGMLQLPQMKTIFKEIRGSEYDPYRIELDTTKTLYKMEREGINLDEEYIKINGDRHAQDVEKLGRIFHDQTRQVFIDSAKALGPLFLAAGQSPPKTKKENDSITDEWLAGINTPLGILVRNIRSNAKSAGFYKSYLWFKGSDGLLHANVNQEGTRTGRFSMSNPNLQQMEDSAIRKSFVAPEGFDLVSLDFDQQEYRVMVDYANQSDLIEEIKGGLDVHKATAKLLSVSREEAKTCIVEGSLVLTDIGLIPIEKVTLKQKVWDGVGWVTHEGVVFQGEKDTIEFEGLEATEDHYVYTEKGYKISFGDYTKQHHFGRIMVTESSGKELRYPYSDKGYLYDKKRQEQVLPIYELQVEQSTDIQTSQHTSSCGNNIIRKSKRKVYDILNAGPRHRFTVSGKLVANCNFLILYGGSTVKLALAVTGVTAPEPVLWVIWRKYNGWKLGKDDEKWVPHITQEIWDANIEELKKAEDLRELYFSKLPKVKEFIQSCKDTALDRGFLYSWTGRRIHFKKGFHYKSPNGLIQGGSSDIMKISLSRVDKLLEKRKSKLIASIHDEIILKIHKEEAEIVMDIKNIMQTTYPHRYLPLTVGVNRGKNLFDMVPDAP